MCGMVSGPPAPPTTALPLAYLLKELVKQVQIQNTKYKYIWSKLSIGPRGLYDFRCSWHIAFFNLVMIHWLLKEKENFDLATTTCSSEWMARVHGVRIFTPKPRLTTCSNCLKLTIRIIFRTWNLQISLLPITSFQQGIKADSVDEQTGHCTYFRSSKFWVQFQVFWWANHEW